MGSLAPAEARGERGGRTIAPRSPFGHPHRRPQPPPPLAPGTSSPPPRPPRSGGWLRWRQRPVAAGGLCPTARETGSPVLPDAAPTPRCCPDPRSPASDACPGSTDFPIFRSSRSPRSAERKRPTELPYTTTPDRTQATRGYPSTPTFRGVGDRELRGGGSRSSRSSIGLREPATGNRKNREAARTVEPASRAVGQRRADAASAAAWPSPPPSSTQAIGCWVAR